VLPPDLAAAYAHDASPALLRPLRQVCALDQAAPLRAPRVAGTRCEYVRLVGRLVQQGMVGFTAAPLAVNGVFAVGKDADSDRLIIDAQPANRLFVDSPGVSLPNPSHLVQLQVPRGQRMFVGKSDLSNFYHHLGLPSWLRPYFALPPLTPQELAQCGAPSNAAYPMCLTLPMGFSHAVFLAQSVHQHVLYSARALDPRDSLLHLLSPTVTHDRAVHGIVIDDLFLFSLDQQRAQQSFDAVLAAYRAAGFVVKDSKVVAPTSAPVKVIGFDIDGAAATVSLPEESQQQLVRTTLAVLAVLPARQVDVVHVAAPPLPRRAAAVLPLRSAGAGQTLHALALCAPGVAHAAGAASPPPRAPRHAVLPPRHRVGCVGAGRGGGHHATHAGPAALILASVLLATPRHRAGAAQHGQSARCSGLCPRSQPSTRQRHTTRAVPVADL
jgi:hypothetical protein